MITKLNGRRHTVLTGVALLIYDKRHNDAQKYQTRTLFGATDVKMADLTGDIIEVYANTADVKNKPGGYIYEGLGCSLVEEITGDYFNAIGLPARKLANEIFELCQADVL
ncbi:n-acetylserotonin O-methyltransferase-like protein [Caerostris extrusa]|uniref:N-acetylserotonin O-methyltransferase-like protein n=1 Tax=Caerostris extrusa TaxID=172846 RepID=A0AAV4M967_CAEEX|nr:n-acetylserotonin O-methyltransferase-like protein [Caerostris extrusa]